MSNLVILAVYHFSRSGQRLLLEASGRNSSMCSGSGSCSAWYW